MIHDEGDNRYLGDDETNVQWFAYLVSGGKMFDKADTRKEGKLDEKQAEIFWKMFTAPSRSGAGLRSSALPIALEARHRPRVTRGCGRSLEHPW